MIPLFVHYTYTSGKYTSTSIQIILFGIQITKIKRHQVLMSSGQFIGCDPQNDCNEPMQRPLYRST